MNVRNVDGTPAFQYVAVPVLTRSHCDITAFRSHPKFGEGSKTPDGGVYNFKCVREALAGLDS